MPTHMYKIRPSRYFAILLLLMFGGAVLVFNSLEIPWWLKLIVSIPLLLGLAGSLRRYALLLSTKSVHKISLMTDGDWCFENRQNRQFRGRLQGDSVVTSYVLILNLKCEKRPKRVSCVVFRDGLSPSEYRQLKVYLLARQKSMDSKR